MKLKYISVFLFLLVPCLTIYFFINYFGIGFARTISDWGATGDFFGGILNPIFSFSTVLLLIYSLRLQLKELHLTREEISLTREEHKKTRKAHEEQLKYSNEISKREKSNKVIKLIEKEEQKIDSCLEWRHGDIGLDNMSLDQAKRAFEGTRRDGIKSKVFLLENSFINKLKLVALYAESNEDDFKDYLIENSLDQLHYLYELKWFFKLTDRSKWLESALYDLDEVTYTSIYKKEIKRFLKLLNMKT
ncbi:hypothetical protein H5158_13240 [Pseudoalteromonas sp. SR45-6]|uniref:hypothetical protein n=1 Tax=Pseudoalteromonas sp. SR45-6 TaxID=2760927 RepID=UPI0016001730|nr:hypothetical protein [Pseudoalteromonas sp. SR45-6]MBB1342597.1 hypothetical protein [Pseudoalteromonas sp. SR45-6]